MTSLSVERVREPSGPREERARVYAKEWAADALAARTVWCARGPGAGRSTLPGRLREVAEAHELELAAREPLLELTRLLEAMLRRAAFRLGGVERELCAQARADGDLLVGERVRPDDVVVLRDAPAVLLAEAVRERGAHVVWQIGAPVSARRVLSDYTRPLHAYLVMWPRGVSVDRRIAALIPAADAVAAMDVDEAPASSDVAWSMALADVVCADRAERVGGTLHARPTVAAR
jgi:hypothetical protein